MAVNIIKRETTTRYDYVPLVETLVMKYSTQKKKKKTPTNKNIKPEPDRTCGSKFPLMGIPEDSRT